MLYYRADIRPGHRSREFSLEALAAHAQQQQLNPQHQSGRQEQLENLVNHYLFDF